MITENEFTYFISNYKTFEDGINKIEEALTGKNYFTLWESDWTQAVGLMFDTFIESHFTEAGQDLINDFTFDEWRGAIYDDDNNVIAKIESLDELWNYMIDNKENYFK